MAPFRVALSADFRKPDGSPLFPDFDLTPLIEAPGVELLYLEPADSLRAEQLADVDALILLTARFTADSIHPNGRLAVVARFGVGYDNVALEALTRAGIPLVITPDGIRRPVAVSIIALMLALTGKLMIKDRLTLVPDAGEYELKPNEGRILNVNGHKVAAFRDAEGDITMSGGQSRV